MSSASAIRAGKAMVELGVNRKGFDREIRDVARMWESFGRQVQAIARPFAIASTAALSAAGAAAVAFASFGDNLDEMAQRTGASVEALSALGYGAKLAGTDLETVEAGMRNLGKVVTEAASGSESASKALASIGLSAADLTSLQPEQQLRLIADGLSSIENPGARATAAMELLGKSGTKLLPLLQGGASGLDAMQKRAEELGLVMSGGAAKAAAELSDAIDEAKLTIQAMTVAVGAALAPHIRRMIRDIAETVGEITRWIQRNNAAVVAAANFAASIAKLAVPLYAMGKATSFASEMLLKLQSGLTSFAALAKSMQGTTTQVAEAATAIANASAMAAGSQRADAWWSKMAQGAQGAAAAATAATPAMTAAAAATKGVGDSAGKTATSIQSLTAKLGMYAAALSVVVTEFTLLMRAVREFWDFMASYSAKISDAAQRRREEGDRARASDLAALDTIRRLAGQHEKTAHEVAILQNMIERLEKSYGPLGLTANATAQQIDAVATAIESKARANRISELNDEIKELQNNIVELGKERDTNVLDVGKYTARSKEFHDLIADMDKRLTEQMNKLAAAKKELLDLKRGQGSLTGDNWLGDAAVQSQISAAETRAALIRRIHDLQIEMIDDELRRAKAAIKAKYDYERDEAQKANADKETLDLIEKARQAELEKRQQDANRSLANQALKLADDIARANIEGIEDPYKREIALINHNADVRIREARKAGHEILIPLIEFQRDMELRNAETRDKKKRADDAKVAADRILAANEEQRLKIKELEIRTKLKGPERDIALKQLERENALANAQKAGLDVGLVKRQYDLEMELLRQEISDRVAEITGRIESVGTFDAYAVAGLGGAGAPDERTARNTEEMLKVLRGMDRRGGLFVN